MCMAAPPISYSPEVNAALIAALVALIGLAGQFLIAYRDRKHVEKLAREAQEHSNASGKKIAELQKKNSEQLLRFQSILGDQEAYRNARRQTLSDLWSAAQAAQFAADGIVEESKSAQPHPILISRTADFLQEISAFLKKAKRPDFNVYLEQADTVCVTTVQDALVGLFLALDPDADDKDTYHSKLDNCRNILNSAMADFGSHLRTFLAPAS